MTRTPGTAMEDASLVPEFEAAGPEEVALPRLSSSLSIALAEPSRLSAVTPVLFTHWSEESSVALEVKTISAHCIHRSVKYLRRHWRQME